MTSVTQRTFTVIGCYKRLRDPFVFNPWTVRRRDSAHVYYPKCNATNESLFQRPLIFHSTFCAHTSSVYKIAHRSVFTSLFTQPPFYSFSRFAFLCYLARHYRFSFAHRASIPAPATFTENRWSGGCGIIFYTITITRSRHRRCWKTRSEHCAKTNTSLREGKCSFVWRCLHDTRCFRVAYWRYSRSPLTRMKLPDHVNGRHGGDHQVLRLFSGPKFY
jgi:hypothetical protein